MTGSLGADIVINVTGYPPLSIQAISSLSRGGSYVEIGTIFPAKLDGLDLSDLVVKGIYLTGYRTYEIKHLKQAIDFVVRNYDRFPFSSMVGITYHLSDIVRAFDDAVSGKYLRVGLNQWS